MLENLKLRAEITALMTEHKKLKIDEMAEYLPAHYSKQDIILEIGAMRKLALVDFNADYKASYWLKEAPAPEADQKPGDNITSSMSKALVKSYALKLLSEKPGVTAPEMFELLAYAGNITRATLTKAIEDLLSSGQIVSVGSSGAERFTYNLAPKPEPMLSMSDVSNALIFAIKENPGLTIEQIKENLESDGFPVNLCGHDFRVDSPAVASAVINGLIYLRTEDSITTFYPGTSSAGPSEFDEYLEDASEERENTEIETIADSAIAHATAQEPETSAHTPSRNALKTQSIEIRVLETLCGVEPLSARALRKGLRFKDLLKRLLGDGFQVDKTTLTHLLNDMDTAGKVSFNGAECWVDIEPETTDGSAFAPPRALAHDLTIGKVQHLRRGDKVATFVTLAGVQIYIGLFADEKTGDRAVDNWLLHDEPYLILGIDPPKRSAKNHAQCKSCGARITWLKTDNDKPMPANDWIRVDDGRWTKEIGAHWSICPNAKAHKKAVGA